MSSSMLLSMLLALATGCGKSGTDSRSENGLTPKGSSKIEAKVEALARKGLDVSAARQLIEAIPSLPPARHAELYTKAARYYHRAGAFESCLSTLDDAARSGDKSPQGAYLRGDSLRELNRPDEARRTLVALVKRHPSYAPGQLSLARLLFRVDDPVKSLPLFEESIRSKPGTLPDDALIEYGRALRAAKRFQESADQFALLLEREPSAASIYSELATTLYRLKLRPQAKFIESIYRTYSQRAFEIEIEMKLKRAGFGALALSQEAVNLEYQKRYLEALRKHENALATDEGDARVTDYYVDLCLQLGLTDRADRASLAAIEKKAKPASGVWQIRGRVLLEMQHPEKALTCFRKALQNLKNEGAIGGPPRGQADAQASTRGLIQAALESRDVTPARSASEAMLARNQQAWQAWYWAGRVLQESGDHQNAIARFEAARKRIGTQKNSDLDLAQARSLHATVQAKAASGFAQSAWQQTPSSVEALQLLLELAPASERESIETRLQSLRDTMGRIDALREKLQRTPLVDCASVLRDLGMEYAKVRDPSAQHCMILSADLDPNDAAVLETLIRGIRRPEDLFFRLRYLRQFLVVKPDSPGALHDFASVYSKLHVQLKEAERCARRFHELEPGSKSYRLLAEILAQRGKKKESESLAIEGSRKHPENAELKKLTGSG